MIHIPSSTPPTVSSEDSPDFKAWEQNLIVTKAHLRATQINQISGWIVLAGSYGYYYIALRHLRVVHPTKTPIVLVEGATHELVFMKLDTEQEPSIVHPVSTALSSGYLYQGQWTEEAESVAASDTQAAEALRTTIHSIVGNGYGLTSINPFGDIPSWESLYGENQS